MPDADAARLAAMIRRIGKDGTNKRHVARFRAQPPLALVEAVAEVLVHNWMMLIARDVLGVLRHQRAGQSVALRESHPKALAAGVFVIAAAGRTARAAWPHADHVNRAMRRIVIGVAEEILRGELPV